MLFRSQEEQYERHDNARIKKESFSTSTNTLQPISQISQTSTYGLYMRQLLKKFEEIEVLMKNMAILKKGKNKLSCR